MSLLGSIFGSLISGAFSSAAQAGTNSLNYRMMQETNQANREMVDMQNKTNLQISRETNAMQKALHELAYLRSLPVRQLREMMAAGMSKQAALSALSGGGTYTAPTLQMAQMQASRDEAPHFDSSGYAAAAEQLANIPSNVMQSQLQEKQLQALSQEYDMRAAEEKRKQELHEYQIWKEQYGKDTATKLDAASNKISSTLLNSGLDFEDFTSYIDLVRGLGLQYDKELSSIPHIAREQLYDSVGKQFAEKRAQKEEERTEQMHAKRLSLTTLQIKQLKQQIADFEAAKDSREKARNLQSISDMVQTIARARDLILDKQAIQDVFEFDKDGNIVMENGLPKFKISERHRPDLYGKIRGFWNDVAEIVPINVLAQVMRFIIH